MNVLIVSANTATYPDPVYPLGAALVADACARAGHRVAGYDCALGRGCAGLPDCIAALSPDVVGISLRNAEDISYPNHRSFLPEYREVVSACRAATAVPLVAGGPAVSLFPGDYARELGVDCCVVGEGEQAMLKVLDDRAASRPIPRVLFAERSLMENHPVLSREFFSVNDYHDCGGMINVQTKRGCGFSCSFCTFPHLEGPSVRARSPRAVVDEIESLLADYGVRHVAFVDSVFNHPEAHARAICEEIIRRNLRIRWTGYARPEAFDRELPALMKAAGCLCLELGTESLSPTTIASLCKNTTVSGVMAFCELCHQANIPFCHGLIFGAPGETRQTVEETISTADSTRPSAVVAMVGVRVYRQTGIARYLVERGALASADHVGLDPLFYVEDAVRDWLIPRLSEQVRSNPVWIVPGISKDDQAFVRSLRARRRRGPAWLFKQYESHMSGPTSGGRRSGLVGLRPTPAATPSAGRPEYARECAARPDRRPAPH